MKIAERRRMFEKYIKEHARRKKRRIAVSCMALAVALCTAYALILPAITLENQTYCGLEEHTHSEECAVKTLVCTLAEAGGHTHTEGCYEEQQTLVCDIAEHAHSAENGCYDGEGSLICEIAEHTHGPDCYSTERALICGAEEAEGHIHTEECYEITYGCGMEEHTHTLDCGSNPEADAETAEDWEKTFSGAELTGEYWHDILAIAETQIGYRESADNYIVTEDGETVKGYTRYGAWYGGADTAYDDWCAMFVSFCLSYGGIPEEAFPRGASCPEWITALKEKGLYLAAAEYMGESGGPYEGDLAFFDQDGDGVADRVGIVSARVFAEDGYTMTGFRAIEGDSGDAVAENEYAMAEGTVLGFGVMPAESGAAEPAAQAVAVTEEPDGSLSWRSRELQPISYNKVDGTGETAYAIAFNSKYMYTGSTTVGNDQSALSSSDDLQLIWHFEQEGGRYRIYCERYLKLDGWNLTLGGDSTCTFALSERASYTDFRSYINGSATNNYINAFGGIGGFQGFAGYDDGGTPGLNIEDTSGNTVAVNDIDKTGNTAYAIVFNGNKYMNTVSKTAGGQSALSSSDGDPQYIWRFKDDGNGRYLIYTEEYLKLDGSGNLTLGGDAACTFALSERSGGDVENDTDFRGYDANVDTTKYINAFGGAGNFQGFSGWSGGSDGLCIMGYVDVDRTAKTVQTVSPTGTVINLFDYWVSEKEDEATARNANYGYTWDFHDEGINRNNPLKFHMGYLYLDDDGTYNTNYAGTEDVYNNFAGGASQGIVKNTLTEGFPELVTEGDSKLLGTTADNASLRYLFDPSIPDSEVGYRKTFANAQGLLSLDSEGYYSYNAVNNFAYFNETDNEATGAKAGSFTVYDTPYIGSGQFFPFSKLSTLIENGVTSQEDYVNLNHYFGVTVTSRFIQQNNGRVSADSTSKPVTFEFTGDDDVWIFIDNVLVADIGGIHGATGVTINFHTGDVTVSSVSRPSGAETKTTIKKAFEDAGVSDKMTDKMTWEGNTFADGTTHTLKFYYLERGGGSSNMQLKYNLIEVPETAVYKVDQYGYPLAGAVFAVYPAMKEGNDYRYAKKNENGEYVSLGKITITGIDAEGVITYTAENGTVGTISPAFKGSTDASGKMSFRDPYTEGWYTMSDLQDMFGEHAILREVHVPEGYRTVTDEAWLKLDNSGNVIICENTYLSGVWASNNAQVTANTPLHTVTVGDDGTASIDKETIEYVTKDVNTGITTTTGTLFAVVLKRNTESLSKIDNWYPIYGSDVKGYTVIDKTDGVYVDNGPDENGVISNATYNSQIEAVIAAAKKQEALTGKSGLVFSVQPSGNVQVLLEHLPGKIDRYYTYLWNRFTPSETGGSKYQQFLTEYENARASGDLDPQYFVAYYYTTADSIGKADEKNTQRVVSRDGIIDDYSGFSIQWGTTIEVPNMENRLFFQKTNGEYDADGKPVLINGAVFALYEVFDAKPVGDRNEGFNYVYYVADAEGTGYDHVYVAPLDNKENDPQPGRAVVFGTNGDSTTVIGYGDYRINKDGIIVDPKDGTISGGEGEIGLITVEMADGTEYYVHPAKNAKNAKNEALVGATHDICDYVAEKGTGHFTHLKDGKYYLREIAAPAGYAANTADIPVLVNENGVYANAGDKDNDVSVGNGVGYLTTTLDVFASPGEIDETLTWVYGALIQNDAKDFSAFDEVSGDVIRVGEGTRDYPWQFVMRDTSIETQGYGSGTSDKREEAMVTYLVYDGKLAVNKDGGEEAENKSNALFDYSPGDQSPRGHVGDAFTNLGNDGVATLEGENNTRRLYTDEGWSDMAIYQDYAYGYAQVTTNSITNYTDLTGYGNISNLFSSSTFVQVTDKRPVEIAVRKVDAASTDTPLSGAEFRLYRIAAETAEDGTETKSKEYYGGEDAGGGAIWTTETDKALAISTDETGLSRTVTLPGDGTYYLEETRAPDGYNLMSEAVKLSVNGEEVTALMGSSSFEVERELNTKTNLYAYTVTIPNSGGYRLPDTGGAGRELYTIGGLLTALAAGYGLRRRRKRGTG